MNAQVVPVKVSPDNARGPGWAWMTFSGGAVDAIAAALLTQPEAWRLTLQRNQDGYFLAAADWSAAEVWHSVQHLQRTAEGWRILLGPDLLDAVLADPRMVCRVQICGQLQAEGIVLAGVLRFDRGVLPSGASGHSPQAVQQAPAPQTRVETPVQETVEAVPVAEPSVERVAATPAPRRKWLLALILLLLAAGVAGYWWWQQSLPTDPAQSSSSGTSGGVVLPSACSQQALQAAADELIFLQGCVADKPDSKTVLAVIEMAKQSDRCDLIQRLYAHQAQAGQVEVALAYAREFDPASFNGGCFKQADAQTALYWYEHILQSQPGRADVAARIKELEAIK